MTRETGLSIEQVEEDDSIHRICAKLIGQISGDVYQSWSVEITSAKVKARFLDFVESEFFRSKDQFPIWEPYELVFQVNFLH